MHHPAALPPSRFPLRRAVARPPRVIFRQPAAYFPFPTCRPRGRPAIAPSLPADPAESPLPGRAMAPPTAVLAGPAQACTGPSHRRKALRGALSDRATHREDGGPQYQAGATGRDCRCLEKPPGLYERTSFFSDSRRDSDRGLIPSSFLPPWAIFSPPPWAA